MFHFLKNFQHLSSQHLEVKVEETPHLKQPCLMKMMTNLRIIWINWYTFKLCWQRFQYFSNISTSFVIEYWNYSLFVSKLSHSNKFGKAFCIIDKCSDIDRNPWSVTLLLQKRSVTDHGYPKIVFNCKTLFGVIWAYHIFLLCSML